MGRTEGYSVARTLAALELLARAPRTTTQLADGLLVHARTARRLLNQLAGQGYAVRSEGPRPVYSLAPRFAALALGALRHLDDEPANRRDAVAVLVSLDAVGAGVPGGTGGA